jgi:uncharacterized protein YbjT (DUF2867 family)
LGNSPEFVEGDIRNPSSLEIAMRGIDAVVSAITGFGPGGDGRGQSISKEIAT